MNIMLGNLKVSDIENRLGIDFPDDVRSFMNESHQDNAMHIQKGKWHCFDIPFHIVCGDMETAMRIYNSVKHRSSECKEPLAFSISQDKEAKQ